MLQYYPFKPDALPYRFDALEPAIDAKTMEIHHNKHLQAYADNLNAALLPYKQYHTRPLEQLITQTAHLPDALQTPVYNNGGGVYNHNFYFKMLAPPKTTPFPSDGILFDAIKEAFGSYEQWQTEMKKSGLAVFGSGWTWLVLTPQKKLKIVNLPNQANVLEKGFCPLLPLDVWEHAYYLKNQNRRADYLNSWMEVVDWKQVERNYRMCISRIEAR